MDGGISGTAKAFARVKIDSLLKDAGWNLTDESSVLFEHALPDGTQADYVLCDRQGRPMAALEANRARIDPVAAQARDGTTPNNSACRFTLGRSCRKGIGRMAAWNCLQIRGSRDFPTSSCFRIESISKLFRRKLFREKMAKSGQDRQSTDLSFIRRSLANRCYWKQLREINLSVYWHLM